MRTSIIIACILTAITGQAWSFGSDDRWTEGFGMGVSEAIVTKGPGNEILAICEAGSGRPSTGIMFKLRDRYAPGRTVTLTFDGDDPRDYMIEDGAITSNSRAAASNYLDAVERMKKHAPVHVRFENGDGARFTLKGAAKAIGDCEPDIFR